MVALKNAATNPMTIWDSMPEWWQRLETLRALRRELTDAEWLEFCELEERSTCAD
jgi:hypothetical protein